MDDIIHDFFIPVLSESVQYDRAVAFFSSSVLYDMTVGIQRMVSKHGHIRYIISPENLSDEDIEAIHYGYDEREKLIIQKMLPVFDNPTNHFEEERLNLLAHLIEDEVLDIKIAFPKNNALSGNGIFHDKCGIMTDEIGNKISFLGSYNETHAAECLNNEYVTVFSSLNGEYHRVSQMQMDFDELWENNYQYSEVIPFPEDLKKVILAHKKPTLDDDIDLIEFPPKHEEEYVSTNIAPAKPENITLFDYQKKAVKNWLDNSGRGIISLCTGAGKTYVALEAIIELIKNKEVAVMICCPYQHLVDQWCADLSDWHINYIPGYSGAPVKQWKKKLGLEIDDFNRNVTDYLCFITTNATFKTPHIQSEIKRIKKDRLLIVDEAHNFGATGLRRLLIDDLYKYRMALSATIDRYNDSEGTAALYNFFGKKCIEYTLKDGIANHQLTPYYYYPVPVSLTPEELETYYELTDQIRKEVRIDSDGKTKKITEVGKRLLIKRARLIAGAKNKLVELEKLMSKEKNSKHILVYCGATTVNDPDFKEGSMDNDEEKQITAVADILNRKLGMIACKFTATENAETRRRLIQMFDDGTACQVLVAIKCLDEGVSIKSIEKAYILASSTNPREYIQRRGRVLRKYPGKEFAYIYDFVTLPKPLDHIEFEDIDSLDLSLVRRELVRVVDFAELAENSRDSDNLIEQLLSKYGSINMNPRGIEDEPE